MQTTHMATPVLEVAHLEKVYGALGNVTRALNDVSFTVNRGEFVGIMGASGSGKTLLADAVLGLFEPNALVRGRIWFDGRPMDAAALAAERGRGIKLMRMLTDSASISPKSTGEGSVTHLVKLFSNSVVAR